MQLYFLRHGIAVDHGAPGYETNDDARPLTDEGVREAKQVAQALKSLVKADAILSSPLPRARRTADIVGKALALDVIETELLGLGFNCDRLAEALIQAQAASNKPLKGVILVGHEPSFSQTVGVLTGSGVRLLLKKTGLVRVDVEADLSAGTLRWLLTPGQLCRLAQ